MPSNIALLGAQDLAKVSPLDLVIAGWPCQGHTRASCGEGIVMTFLVQECYGSPKKHENSLKFVKIRAKECFDEVLNEEFLKI